MARLFEITAKTIKQARRQIIKTVALQATKEIVSRVQEEGKAANDRKFKGYSTKPARFVVPTSRRLVDKRIGKKPGKTRRKAKTRKFDGGYKEYREFFNRETNFVNLTFSGQMMNNLKPKSIKPDRVVIGFTNQLAQEKADNTERLKGSWVGLSTRQLKRLSRQFEVQLAKTVEKIGITVEIR